MSQQRSVWLFAENQEADVPFYYLHKTCYICYQRVGSETSQTCCILRYIYTSSMATLLIGGPFGNNSAHDLHTQQTQSTRIGETGLSKAFPEG